MSEQPTPPPDRKDLFQGDFVAVPVSGDIGKGKGGYRSRIEFRIVSDGAHKNRVVPFEGKLGADNIKFTKRAMMAVGWQGKSTSTFKEDVAKSAKAGREVPVTVRIAHFIRDDGSISWWSSVDRVGRYTPPLEQTADDVAKMDEWFAEVGDSSEASSGNVPPPSDGDYAGYNRGGGGASTAGSLPGDDIPFATSEMDVEPGTARRRRI